MGRSIKRSSWEEVLKDRRQWVLRATKKKMKWINIGQWLGSYEIDVVWSQAKNTANDRHHPYSLSLSRSPSRPTPPLINVSVFLSILLPPSISLLTISLSVLPFNSITLLHALSHSFTSSLVSLMCNISLTLLFDCAHPWLIVMWVSCPRLERVI